MSDIAERAGVSQSTVSLVLNDRASAVRISEATQQKVLRAAEEMGYRMNHQARAMRTGNTRMVGIVGGDLKLEQVGAMLSGVLEEIESQNYTLKMLPSREGDGPEFAQAIIRRGSELRLAGVIALHLPADWLHEIEEETRRFGYPLVLLDTHAPFDGVPQVLSDDASGVALIVEHLCDLGHRRIGMIAGVPSSAPPSPREQRFRAEMARRGLDVPEDMVAHGDYREHTPSVQAARVLLGREEASRATALFCAGDRIALAAMQVAAQEGLRVPHDLSVVGYADLSIASFAAPALTTVRQDFQLMGRMAARRLLQEYASQTAVVASHASDQEPQDQSKPTPHHPAPHRPEWLELVPDHLIIRGTTAPPNSKASPNSPAPLASGMSPGGGVVQPTD